ncbi:MULTISPECIES: DUF5681 domain-containing protein [Sphingomonas]|uniref:DUF5681 domain-containing protein n=1 Tax=Sphingomonas TaxID=13687 RepID=UPI000DEF8EAF|nr:MULTISPECIES: DUF5681 domain-containing protein [Sphingomonas]
METSPEPNGYGKPPTASRFKPGQSGNPRGRPRGRSKDIPYDGLLGQMVTIREDGRQRRVTAAEAFLLHLTKKGLAGDSAAARASLEAIEIARAKRQVRNPIQIRIVWKGFSPGSVGSSIEPLGIATLLNRYSEEKARFELKPWIVQVALNRLGKRRLTVEEQRTVIEATRTPQQVQWPEWWTVRS